MNGPVRPLNSEEQRQFREDYQEKEREINRYIAIYLSALAVVTGWILGPQSKTALELFLGNNGYNLCGWLLILSINIIFSCFLTYKSIIIHEIMQFVTYLSPRDSAFQYWESWRRSPQSATMPVRWLYTGLIAAVPMLVALIIFAILTRFLFVSSYDLASWVGADPSKMYRSVVLARVGSVTVLLLHLIPLRFFHASTTPVLRKWEELAALRPEVPTFDQLVKDPFGSGATRRLFWLS